MKAGFTQIKPPGAAALANCFNCAFGENYNVRCIGGGIEPSYLPQAAAPNSGTAQLTYREDFPASALHEIAHWCIAGRERRALEDFGYQYVAPPRTPLQQQYFFKLEQRAQAVEKLFAIATGVEFVESADNLDINPQLVEEFADAVNVLFVHMTKHTNARPPRAQQYLEALVAAGLTTLGIDSSLQAIG